MTTTPKRRKMSRIQSHTAALTEKRNVQNNWTLNAHTEKMKTKLQTCHKTEKIVKGTRKIRARKIISCFRVFMLFRALWIRSWESCRQWNEYNKTKHIHMCSSAFHCLASLYFVSHECCIVHGIMVPFSFIGAYVMWKFGEIFRIKYCIRESMKEKKQLKGTEMVWIFFGNTLSRLCVWQWQRHQAISWTDIPNTEIDYDTLIWMHANESNSLFLLQNFTSYFILNTTCCILFDNIPFNFILFFPFLILLFCFVHFPFFVWFSV